LSGEVWTFSPLSDASKTRVSNSSSSSSPPSAAQHGSIHHIPAYPAQNNLNNPMNNNNNPHNGFYNHAPVQINNPDSNTQFVGDENKKYKVSVSFDRYEDSKTKSFIFFSFSTRRKMLLF
jgi:hypothetical protein